MVPNWLSGSFALAARLLSAIFECIMQWYVAAFRYVSKDPKRNMQLTQGSQQLLASTSIAIATTPWSSLLISPLQLRCKGSAVHLACLSSDTTGQLAMELKPVL